ncbi:DNA gyrase subunit A [Candidatus Bipolaricaulota bacterium]|nr:DNA gyrase subunit A [Candidatus Bipolaricaulota bacterium]MBS3814647.1 DNA gyrase subunit A [Candidatus Bipolaricaulota bacterium]MBS3825612.1 DNA gyrase subunit A [Candidatus Bipolaricaulota bacterium]
MSEVKTAYIEEEMEESYINYAMSVIRGRAIPDVRDGLKPAQRRILYALDELGLYSDGAPKKSARIVGEVLGKYHPHGDIAVYDTMVNMAQEFSFRYPLIDGQGNFGSIDGDSQAAMRYTEARLSPISETFLEELDEDTVDFSPNFDDSLEEPKILPAKVPGLLLNGSWGISVGMTTKVPPHNLTELIEGLIYLIDNPEASLEELMKYIRGPDFPTGAIILGREGIKEAYRSGKGRVRMRAKTQLEGNNIIITEIPFQIKKSTIIERIADKAKDGTIEGITDVRDESDREGLRVVIKLKQGTEPTVALNRLFKYTPLEKTYGANMTVIVDGNPRRLSLKEILNSFIDFRRSVVERRTEYRLEKAESRAHILEGLQIALDSTDMVIKLIREADTRDEARGNLIERFSFSKDQANAILKMQLGRLTSLEREKINDELEEKREYIEKYREILSSTLKLNEIIKNELREIKEEFGDERRSLITEKVEEVDAERLIPDHSVIVQLTENGYVNAPKRSGYKTQNRAGKGVICMDLEEDDRITVASSGNSRNESLLFTDEEKVYKVKTYKLPSMRRDSRGERLGGLLDLSDDEVVTAALNLKREELTGDRFCLMGTRGGNVVKNPVGDFSSAHISGIHSMNAGSGDSLSSVTLSRGGGEIIMATREGQVIRFPEDELRTTQRPSRGVKGMSLSPGDQVVSLEAVSQEDLERDPLLLFVTEKGRGKKVPLSEFSSQKRAGKGNLGIKLDEDDGLREVELLERGEEVLLYSERGKAIRLSIDDISQFQRYARGVKLMELEEFDLISATTVI